MFVNKSWKLQVPSKFQVGTKKTKKTKPQKNPQTEKWLKENKNLILEYELRIIIINYYES